MGIGWVQLLIVLGIVILIFGTKKLRNIGGDLGGAIRNFKSSIKDGTKDGGGDGTGDGAGNGVGKVENKSEDKSDSGRVIDVESVRKEDEKS